VASNAALAREVSKLRSEVNRLRSLRPSRGASGAKGARGARGANGTNGSSYVAQNVFDGAALQAKIDAAIRVGGFGGEVKLPDGDIYINDTITIQGVRWLLLLAGGATNLIWNRIGTPDRPMFKIIDSADCVFEGFTVTCSEPLLEVVRIQSGPTPVGSYVMEGLQTSHLTFRNWTIRGQDQLGVGFRTYVRDGEPSIRCDHMRFEDCRVAGYKYSAYHFEGRNSKDLVISDSFTQGISPVFESLYCVDNSMRGPEASGYNGMIAPSGSESYNNGGSYSFTGQCSGNAVNFRLMDRANVIEIGKCYSEKSTRHVDAPDYGTGSSAPLPLTLINNHFAVHSTQFAEDGEVVRYYATGPLTIIGGEWGRGKEGEQIRFRKEGAGTFILKGASISNDGDGNVFPYHAPTNPEYQTVNDGFRDGEWGLLGVGVVVPTDGPALRPFPMSPAQWKLACEEAGVAITSLPSSQYRAQDVLQIPVRTNSMEVAAGDLVLNSEGNIYKAKTGGTTAAVGGEPTGTGNGQEDGEDDEEADPPVYAVVWNYFGTGSNIIRDRIGTRHGVTVGTPLYGQTETDYEREFIKIAEDSGDSMCVNTTDYSPIDNAVLWILEGRIIANTGNAKLIQLGNTSTTVGGGGLILQINTTGEAFLCHDGDVADVGGYTYEDDDTVHRFVLFWDADEGTDGFFALWSDEEALVATPAAPIVPANNATKGIGANSGEPPEFTWSDLIIFEGAAARAWATPEARAYLGVDDTAYP